LLAARTYKSGGCGRRTRALESAPEKEVRTL
jgi:hypothetical protein